MNYAVEVEVFTAVIRLFEYEELLILRDSTSDISRTEGNC